MFCSKYLLLVALAMLAIAHANFIDEIDFEEESSSEESSLERVIGGRTAKPDEFPWQATVFIDAGLRGRLAVGGALISSRHVLTLANKLHHSRRTTVVFGSRFRRAPAANVRDVFVHPRYQQTRNDLYNLAVLRLTAPVKSSATVRPVALARVPIELGENVTISGFGTYRKYSIILYISSYMIFVIKHSCFCCLQVAIVPMRNCSGPICV